MEKIISFDQLPNAVNQLNEKLDYIERLLIQNQELPASKQSDQWLDLNELIEYDPEKRTKATWYSKVSKGEVPYHKKGKKLVFLKSDIDEWLKAGRRKTNSEIELEAKSYLNRKSNQK